MFDIIDFVKKSGMDVIIRGFDNPDLVPIQIATKDGYGNIMFFMVRQPDETDDQYYYRLQVFIEGMAALIGKDKAGQISAKQVSRQLAERERFFREGKGWSDDN